MDRPIHRVVDLIDEKSQQIFNMEVEEARELLLRDDATSLMQLLGSFALTTREGEVVRMARSLDRPMRYFLAKQESGPLLVVADRIDEIQEFLDTQGYGDQFHPSYTRMVPAHHVTSIRLIGCPDPNPIYQRFLEPSTESLPADLDLIGERYVAGLWQALDSWLQVVPPREPIGVLFSGGLDSGSVLLCLYKLLLERGQSPSRLKAFTLSVDGLGSDGAQAREFLRQVDLEVLGEQVEVDSDSLDPFEAVDVIEDYKPLDVECATVNLALVQELRRLYPEWLYLVDGDGGDENLKDYPIEENRELTIRSVVGNPLLYQEGWGVDRIKHSLTYSNGQSRGCVRVHAPLRKYGFLGFSPFTHPSLVSLATAIPFDELTRGSIEKLYALKSEVLKRGVKAVTGMDLPVFPKRRFQEGAGPESVLAERFAADPEAYRNHYLDLYRHGHR
ncbi:MAG: asparagine synthetase B family protein [Nitrospirae bacterium]|nr:asparagine synthetase B family protein [Nitrospirota bacterium]